MEDNKITLNESKNKIEYSQLEPNNVYNGDCMELLNYIQEKSVDCIITDLPYGQTKNKWDIVIPMNDYVIWEGQIYDQTSFILELCKLGVPYNECNQLFDEQKKPGLWSLYNKVIKDDGVIILFGNGLFTMNLMSSNKEMWRYNLIWEKTQPTGFQNANIMPMRSHEDICVFYKKKPTYNPQKTDGHARKVSLASHKRNSKQSTNYNDIKAASYDSTERFPNSIWKFAKDIQKEALHPTQKPIALLQELIKTYTNKGELVLDSCAGSMSTAIACMDTERQYICIEQDEEMYKIGKTRIDNHSVQYTMF